MDAMYVHSGQGFLAKDQPVLSTWNRFLVCQCCGHLNNDPVLSTATRPPCYFDIDNDTDLSQWDRQLLSNYDSERKPPSEREDEEDSFVCPELSGYLSDDLFDVDSESTFNFDSDRDSVVSGLSPASFLEEPMNETDLSSTGLTSRGMLDRAVLEYHDRELESIVPSPSASLQSVEGREFLITHMQESFTEESRSSEQRPDRKRKISLRGRLNSSGSDCRESNADSETETVSELSSPRSPCRPIKRSCAESNNFHLLQSSKASRPRHLYEFLIDLLQDSAFCPRYIDWVSRKEGVFRLVDSAGVAQLWGQCKNRENMTYEKMSRALRYYYENGILERVPNCRLHYKFGKNICKDIFHVDC